MANNERRPFPQLNAFRPFVSNELLRRKTDYPTPIIAPFVRMTSTGIDEDQGYMFFSIGLHGYDSPSTDLFNTTYGIDREVVGYAYDIKNIDQNGMKRRLIYADDINASVSSQFGPEETSIAQSTIANQKAMIPKASRPIPGITDATVTRSGLGQPLIASITWQCYNRGQLEFLRNHFLIPGNYVILEFGNQFSDKQITKTLDFSNKDTVLDTLMTCIGINANTNPSGPSQQIGRQFIIDHYNKPNDGNYDFIIGQIGNFEIKFIPESTTYQCITQVVSQGENVWGLPLVNTYINQQQENTSPISTTGNAIITRPNKITTIAEYFSLGKFNAFIESKIGKNTTSTSQLGIVRRTGAMFSNGEIASDDTELYKVSTNPDDYAFFSWDFLFNDFFNDMLNVIQDPGIVTQLKQYLNFATPEVGSFVGYNKDLLSSEPESLILITKNNESFAAGFDGPPFGTTLDTSGAGAKINEGVWINSQAIRESFQSSTDLIQAINTLLARLNRSVGNYWQLQIFYDEESSSYKIIDYKYGNFSRDLTFYKFNAGTVGECKNIEFDSAFPPELITQMMLVSKFKSSSPEEQQQLIQQYPLLGSTSRHMFVLNWTALKDELQDKIKTWRDGKSVQEGSVSGLLGSQNSGKDSTDTIKTTTTNRLTAGNEGGQYINSIVALGQGQAPGQKVGTPNAQPVLSPNSISPFNSATRNSVTPPLPTPNPFSADPFSTDPFLFVQIPRNPPGASVELGSLAYRNNNPGNLEYVGQAGASPGTPINGGTDKNGNQLYWARFNTPEDGYKELVLQLARYRDEYFTLKDCVYVYAPPSENDSALYLSQAEQALNAPADTSLTSIDLNELARFISKKESQTTVVGNAMVPPFGTADKTGYATKNLLNKNFSYSKAAPATANQPDVVTKTPEQLKQESIDLKRAEVSMKYGEQVYSLIAKHLGDMIAKITKSGYDDFNTPNSYVAPFPTTTSVSVEILGISGISISDGFFLDKIPFTFEKFGVFQVTEVQDALSSKGWLTTIKGYFKMLWYDGKSSSKIE